MAAATLAARHEPVLLQEVLQHLNISPTGTYIDATFGSGGHARAILAQLGEQGSLLGIDMDQNATERIAQLRLELPSLGSRLFFKRGNFSELASFARDLGFGAVDGILFDLGWSLDQLKSRPGLSYQDADSLDMRLSDDLPLSAADLVEQLGEADLAALLKNFGEERFSGRIAAAIVRERDRTPFTTAKALSDLIVRTVPRTVDKHLHPATRVFQALRIVVNREFENLASGLQAATDLLTPGGRLLVITFHSLEDRLVKRFLRLHSGHCVCFLSPTLCRCDIHRDFEVKSGSPIKPSPAELKRNRRARSAKLRVATRLER